MRDRALAAADPHKADLVWQPWEHLESNWEKQRQGEERAPVSRARQALQEGRLGPARSSTELIDSLLSSRCSGESSG